MKMLVAMVQLVLHYLAWAGGIFGVIALVFGNYARAWELLIGGASLLVLKYVIGFAYLGVLKLTTKSNQDNPQE